jgi:hypothetical protein
MEADPTCAVSHSCSLGKRADRKAIGSLAHEMNEKARAGRVVFLGRIVARSAVLLAPHRIPTNALYGDPSIRRRRTTALK